MSEEQVPMTVLDLAEAGLVQDPDNARTHTPENLDAIGMALDEVGAARGIVIDENNTIWCGNATAREALKRGMKLLVIDRPSKDTLLAYRVTGLTDREKKRMALFDNRAAELAKWNRKVLKKMAAPDQGLLEGLFDARTLDELKGAQIDAETERVSFDAAKATFECPSCGYAWDGNPKPPKTNLPLPGTAVQSTETSPEGEF